MALLFVFRAGRGGVNGWSNPIQTFWSFAKKPFCLIDVGPASETLGQRQSDNGSLSFSQWLYIDTWEYASVIQSVCMCRRVQQDGVFILEPFIKFLLLEPVQGSEYAALRQCAVSTLLQTPESSRIIGFILRILPCMQVRLGNHTSKPYIEIINGPASTKS